MTQKKKIHFLGLQLAKHGQIGVVIRSKPVVHLIIVVRIVMKRMVIYYYLQFLRVFAAYIYMYTHTHSVALIIWHQQEIGGAGLPIFPHYRCTERIFKFHYVIQCVICHFIKHQNRSLISYVNKNSFQKFVMH